MREELFERFAITRQKKFTADGRLIGGGNSDEGGSDRFLGCATARPSNTGGRDRMRGPCSHSRALGHLKRDLFADRAKPFDRAGTDAKRSNLFFIGISDATGQKYLRSTRDIRDLMRQQPARARLGQGQGLAPFA